MGTTDFTARFLILFIFLSEYSILLFGGIDIFAGE